MADSDELSLVENDPEIETVQEPPAKKQALAVPMLLGQPMAKKNPHTKPLPINDLMDRLNLPRFKIVGTSMHSLVWSISERGFSKYADPNLDHLVVCEECIHTEGKSHSEIDYGRFKATSNIKSHLAAHQYKINVSSD